MTDWSIGPQTREADLARFMAMLKSKFAKAETDARNADPVVTEYLNRAAEARAAGCYLDPIVGMARARATIERDRRAEAAE